MPKSSVQMAICGMGREPNQAHTEPSSYRPWLGFRHPCRNDGIFGLAGLVYNDECRSVGTHGKPILRYVDAEYPGTDSHAAAWEPSKSIPPSAEYSIICLFLFQYKKGGSYEKANQNKS